MSRRARRESAAPVGFDPETYGRWFETELGQLVWEDERAALLLRPLERLLAERRMSLGAAFISVAAERS